MQFGKERQRKSENLTFIIPAEFYVSIKPISRSLGVIALRLSRSQLKTDTARIKYLQGLGFDRNDIAGILDTTPATVSVRLSERRSGKKNQRKKRGKN